MPTLRRCGMCRRGPRANDPMGELIVQPGNLHGDEPGRYQACAVCIAKHDPSRPDLYSQPCPPIQGFGPEYAVINSHYCGICKRFAREGEMSERTIRLGAEEVEGTTIEVGHYMCCRECFDLWAPLVLARLIRQGVFPAGMTVRTMPRNAVA